MCRSTCIVLKRSLQLSACQPTQAVDHQQQLHYHPPLSLSLLTSEKDWILHSACQVFMNKNTHTHTHTCTHTHTHTHTRTHTHTHTHSAHTYSHAHTHTHTSTYTHTCTHAYILAVWCVATSKKLPCLHKANTDDSNTCRCNIMTGGLLETGAAMAERAVTFPRTVRLAPGMTTVSSRRERSDQIGWYMVP